MKIHEHRWSGPARALLAVLREPDPERRLAAVEAAGEAAVFETARDNEVASVAAHRLADARGWEALSPRWRDQHARIEGRIGAYMAELDRVADRLAAQDIPVVALKNAGIARAIHRCPGCSPMGDLDVLVREQDFRRAHRAIIEAGYAFEFRSPLEEEEIEAAARGGGGEYRRVLEDGEELWLEVQWRPVAGRWIRPDQEPDSRVLMERSVDVPGSSVRILAPEDNLLQVALHTAKHSYVRAPGFRLHLDVHRIVEGSAIDWEVFVARARELEVRTAVYFSLAIPSALFGTPVPDRVLDALAPGALKRRVLGGWIQRAGLLDPLARKFSNPGYLLFTALLYDTTRGRLRAVFPETEWMRKRYDIRHDFLIPFYHLRRLADLGLRRTL